MENRNNIFRKMIFLDIILNFNGGISKERAITKEEAISKLLEAI
jgi:hypothetical protein